MLLPFQHHCQNAGTGSPSNKRRVLPNRAQAYQDYLDDLLDYHEQRADGTPDALAEEPTWKEWDVPTLHQTCIQANANVVILEPAHDSTFDFWLKISTLEFRKQLLVPVKLANYHRKALAGKTINTSVTLNKRDTGWWLTLSYDQVVPIQTKPSAPVIGIDVGIAATRMTQMYLAGSRAATRRPIPSGNKKEPRSPS